MKLTVAGFVFAIMLSICISTRGQMIKGQYAVEISGGQSDIGYLANGGYTLFLSNRLGLKTGAFFESGNPFQLPYKNFGLEELAKFNILSLNNIIFLTPYGGITANYDRLTETRNDRTSLNFGLKAGIEAELALSNKFTFFGCFNQLFLKSNVIGRARYDYDLGIRFYIGL